LNREVQNISLDDIHIIKKYGLDVRDLEIGEHDYAIPQPGIGTKADLLLKGNNLLITKKFTSFPPSGVRFFY
jgi:hypothetical protein